MIDFRYHLVSIIAIFFALAAGIVLGAGPLGDRVDQDLTGQLSAMREENQNLREQVDTLQATGAAQEEFVNAVTPALVSGELEGDNVAIIALPGAEEEVIESVRDALEQAGATAELQVQIEPKWADGDSEAVLDSLASQLVSSGVELPEDGDGYTRGGTVLAAALLARPAEGVESTGQTVETSTVAAFQEAGLINLVQDAGAAPTLAVMVAGQVSGEDVEDRTSRLLDFVTQVDAQSAGAVAAGAPITAEDGGLIATIRSDEDAAADAVSTVDSTGTQSGAVSIVFALLQQNQGGVGHYGVVGDVDGVIPPVPERTSEKSEEDAGNPPEDPSVDPTDGLADDSEQDPDADSDEDPAAGADESGADG